MTLARGSRERSTVEGTGLHSGRPCRVTLERVEGPLVLVQGPKTATLDDLVVERTDSGVAVTTADGELEIDLVEHFFAALAGLGIRSNLRVTVEGPEMPLLDGGSERFARALLPLAIAPTPPSSRIARADEVRIGASVYRFETGDRPHVEVTVEFEAEAIGRQTAAWDGSLEAFVRDVAPARTFGFLADAERLRAAGRARHVDPHAVIVLDDAGRAVAPSRTPAGPDEIARHKLLDLIGDAYFVAGGPPRGRLAALRPGHRATHAALAAALERGVILRS